MIRLTIMFISFLVQQFKVIDLNFWANQMCMHDCYIYELSETKLIEYIIVHDLCIYT